MMTGKEKLYFLLNAIADARTITPSGQPVQISPVENLNNRISIVELNLLLAKLGNDEQVLKVLKTTEWTGVGIVEQLDPYDDGNYDDGYFYLQILPAFENYYKKIQQESEYQKFTGRKPPVVQPQNATPSKYPRRALEKIWDILQEIDEKRSISSTNDDIAIPQVDLRSVGWDAAPMVSDERFNLLRKLENEGAIENMKWPHDYKRHVHLKLGSNFENIFKKYEQAYKNAAKEYQETKQEDAKPSESRQDVIYEIKYAPKTREILINNFLVSRPNSFSENDEVFEYLYRNPNKEISLEEIETNLRKKLTKSFSKILENLGFVGSLKNIFFKASKDKIMFVNPATVKDLEELGIKHLKLK